MAAVLVTSGCAAGRDAQTANQVPTQDGTNADVGTMALRGISLVAPTGSSYAPGSTIRMRLVLVNQGIRKDSLTNIVTSVARGWAGYRNSAQAARAISQQSASTTPGSSGPSASAGTTSTSTAPASGTTTTATGTHSKHAKKTPSATPTPSPTATIAPVPKPETAIVIPPGQRVSYGVPDSKRVLVLLTSVGRVYPGSTVKITFTFARAGSVSVQVPVQLSSGAGDSTVSAAGSGD